MSEHISHEQYVNSVREQVVRTARAMLGGQLSYLEGTRTLVALRHEAAVKDDDADLMVFVAIDSETDALPIGHVREHWDKEALARLEPEIRAAEAWAKKFGADACAALIGRFARDT